MGRSTIGELAQVKGMSGHVLASKERMQELFKRMESRAKKGKVGYTSKEVLAMTKSLTALHVGKDTIDIAKDNERLIDVVRRELGKAYNGMAKTHEAIESICSPAEMDAYFEMSEDISEMFDIYHNSKNKKVLMNLMRNFK